MRFGHKRRHGGYIAPAKKITPPVEIEPEQPDQGPEEPVLPPVEPVDAQEPDTTPPDHVDGEQPEETETEEEGIEPDASSHEWDAERYQTDAEGNPRYSVNGNFILRPGQSHADAE